MKYITNILNRNKIATDSKAREILDKLMEGTSTRSEERQLYAYYRRSNLPADMEEQREFVEWLDSGLDDSKLNGNKRHRTVWLQAVAGIAAAVILIVGIMNLSSPGEPDYSLYAGSYVIENGKKINDIEVIYPKLLEADRKIAEAQRKIEEQLSAMKRVEAEVMEITMISPEDSVIKQIARSIDNPRLRHEIIEGLRENY